MNLNRYMLGGMLLLSLAGVLSAEELILTASKDTFVRSNQPIKNGGGSAHLVVSSIPYIRSLVAFDLSEVSKEVIKAELRVRKHDTNDKKINLVIAPMVYTTNNASWGEGSSALGVIGANAQEGTATYLRSAYMDVKWESGSGASLNNIVDASLWKSPVASLKSLPWVEGEWISIPLEDLSLVEDAITRDPAILTFGLWGTDGNGTYLISSRSSSYPPELRLTFEDEEEEDAAATE